MSELHKTDVRDFGDLSRDEMRQRVADVLFFLARSFGSSLTEEEKAELLVTANKIKKTPLIR